MGYDVDVKVTPAAPTKALTLAHCVMAATANFRDRFRETVGSEPIVEALPNNMYEINTYGAGKFVNVGRFGLVEMPGCCGVVVFFHAAVAQEFQKRGLGSLFLEVRERAAILAGYTMAQATVIKYNKAERSIMERASWKEVFSFDNKRTGNALLAFVKQL